ncbi:hypothetical protein CWATWH8502_450 [Crocosphaera watsonii WH 8502]|uniref:Uncharacterized protein n=1 Tax=Crocosphaera watsonii WH 8502 TaxID=423474 RepID=T2IGW6_CROWT|nr:hypothetical protein CWATWH8502_450 [Crocosphaera watsonii WH 8502]
MRINNNDNHSCRVCGGEDGVTLLPPTGLMLKINPLGNISFY